MAKQTKCNQCGARLILYWIGGHIPWYACPHCDKKELDTIPKVKEVHNG